MFPMLGRKLRTKVTRFAVSNAIKMSFPRVIFEGDAKLVFFPHWWIQIASPLGKCPQSWMIFPHFVIPFLTESFLL